MKEKKGGEKKKEEGAKELSVEHRHIKHKHIYHKHNAKRIVGTEKKKEEGVKELPLIHRKLVDEKDIAMDFAEKAYKKFDRLIKASILFGSQAKNESRPGSDIDIIFIIDDAAVNWDMELIAWYREELGRLMTAAGYSKELHINTIKLTTWWQDLMQGDPVVLNILRYGEALIDYGGFFNPLKSLLIQGRIRSTPEAVYNALQRAPIHLGRSKLAILGSIEGVYWTMIDAAQAALITAGQLPPSPEQIPHMMKTEFVDKGMLKIDKVRLLREIYVLHKGINHREIHEIKGQDIDKWQDAAEKFLLEMTHLIDQILDSKR